MDANPELMRFGSDTPSLQAPALIAIAVAVAVFIVWLAVGTRDPDALDVLKWIAAALIGAIGIAFAGSWHEVVVDPVAKRVTERHGFLAYPVNALGQQLRFADITAVVVEQKTSKESEATSTSTSRGTKTVYRKSYVLSLERADAQLKLPEKTITVPQHAIDLPTKESDPLSLEAAARQLARLGPWPARRRGYALSVADKPGEHGRPYTITSVPYGTESAIDVH